MQFFRPQLQAMPSRDQVKLSRSEFEIQPQLPALNAHIAQPGADNEPAIQRLDAVQIVAP